MNLSKKCQSLRKCLSPLLRLRLFKGMGEFVLILYLIIVLLVVHHFSKHYPTDSTMKVNTATTPSINISVADFEPDAKSDLACPIPQLELFSEEVNAHLKSVFDEEDKAIQDRCGKKYPKLFESTVDGKIVPVSGAEKFNSSGIKSCCYKTFRRGGTSWATFIEILPICHPLSLQNATKIPADHEFIEILCENKVVDLHSFIHVKPEVEKGKKVMDKSKRRANVILFGIDSNSRMNFHRFMPKSRSYLMDELKAVDMSGYNKVGENTRQAIIPLLTSHFIPEAKSRCVRNGKFYDSCPLIWKLYGEQGYRTSYAEDWSLGYIFGGAGTKQLSNQVGDYDFRPYSVEAERKGKHFGFCYGPRLTPQVLLDNTKKFVYQMEKIGKPYFQFTWTTAFTHGKFTAGKFVDKPLLEMLKWMKTSGSFKETVFILMSDHGIYGSFGDTIQGQIEDRLPFLYLVLPDWMRTGKYSRAFKNLVGNRERLMTVFDLRQFLLDILHLDGIENAKIAKREMKLSKTQDKSMPRGISLFLPIPKKRTCEMAAIPLEFCVCKQLLQLRTNISAANEAALITIDKINSIVNSNKGNYLELSLSSIIKAGHDNKQQSIGVNFQTMPGNTTFEALVGVTQSINGTSGST